MKTLHELDLSYRITKKEFTKWLRDTINHYRKRLKWECKRETLEKHDKYWIVEDIDARKENEIWVYHLGWYYSFNFEEKNFRDWLLEYYIDYFSKTDEQIQKARNCYWWFFTY